MPRGSVKGEFLYNLNEFDFEKLTKLFEGALDLASIN